MLVFHRKVKQSNGTIETKRVYPSLSFCEKDKEFCFQSFGSVCVYVCVRAHHMYVLICM